MLAEGHRRQIAPGSGVVRSRGGMGWPSLPAGRASVATPWDPAGSRRDIQASWGGSASPTEPPAAVLSALTTSEP